MSDPELGVAIFVATILCLKMKNRALKTKFKLMLYQRSLLVFILIVRTKLQSLAFTAGNIGSENTTPPNSLPGTFLSLF